MLCKVLTVGLMIPVLVVPAAAAAPSPAATERTCRGATASIVGTGGDDRLTGTRGRDVIAGLGGHDKIFGLSGNDVLCGNGGADDLVGGRGHDQLYGGRDGHEQRGRRTVISGDLLEGGPGDDLLSAGFDEWGGRGRGRVVVLRRNRVSYHHSTRAVTVDLDERVAVGEGSDVVVPGRYLEVTGTRYDDVLHGSRRSDVFDGGRGDDQVFGGGGRDVVLSYLGDDELHGEQGRDLVISTAGVAMVDGGDGGDFLVASSPAATTLLGGAGVDYLSRWITAGETGVIDGGADADQLELIAQLWLDRDPSAALDAEAATAVITAGDDTHTTAFTSIDHFTLGGTPWTFRGTEASDFVQILDERLDARGMGGDDYLLGADRADVLDGGEGTDAAWGGKGQNTCIDIEAGNCNGYPWNSDSVATRARVTSRQTTSPTRAAPHRLVSRWMNHQTPFVAN